MQEKRPRRPRGAVSGSVDLTGKECLPDWLPPESVGGKLPIAGADEINEASSRSLGELATALKAATQTPRFFRTYQEWLGAWPRVI